MKLERAPGAVKHHRRSRLLYAGATVVYLIAAMSPGAPLQVAPGFFVRGIR
jgi:hypothetical protein